MPAVRSTPGGTKKDDPGRDKVEDMRLRVDDMRLSPKDACEDGRRKKSDKVDETDDERRMNACTSCDVRLGTIGSPRSGGEDCMGGSKGPPVVLSLSWHELVSRDATAANDNCTS